MIDVIREVLYGSPSLTWGCVFAIICMLVGKQHLASACCLPGFVYQVALICGYATYHRWDLLPTCAASLVFYGLVVTVSYGWIMHCRKCRGDLDAPQPHDVKEEAPVDPSLLVPDKEFAQAQRLIEFGVRHPAVKEIAQLKGITPRQVILDCEETVRNWNLQNRERAMR